MKKQIILDVSGGIVQSIGVTKGLEDVEFIIKDYDDVDHNDDFPKASDAFGDD